MYIVPRLREPVRHLARIFPDSGRLGMEINSVDEDAHRLCLACNDQQTIASTDSITKPQHGEEHKPAKDHQDYCQKWVAQLSVFRTYSCKQPCYARLGKPQCRRNLPGFHNSESCL